ncbi:hypothetical protein QJR26_04555 [Clostridium baratii]
MIRSMKKHLIMGMALIGVTSIIYYMIYSSSYLNINIINKTSSIINGLRITSNLLEKDIIISDIEPEGKKKIQINSLTEIKKGNGSMLLRYEVENKNAREVELVKNIKDKYTGKINVIMKEDEIGRINICIRESLGLHNILN